MEYKNFKQKDLKWKNNYYSGGTISAQGCGPTSIADAVYDLEPTISPAKTAKLDGRAWLFMLWIRYILLRYGKSIKALWLF